MGILGADFVVTQSAEEANNPVRNPFAGFGKSEYIDLKLALSKALAKHRKKNNLTQAQLAKMLKSSQSRIAKMEKGDPTVSMGANKKSIAKAIA